MSRRKKLQLPVNSSSPASCPVISSYFKTDSAPKPEKSLKLSKFIASEPKSDPPVEPSVPKKSILNFLNFDEDFEKTPLKKIKKAPAPKTKKPKKEKVTKKQPKIKSALLKQEEALSEAITYQSLTEDIDPDELRLALAISRSEAESKGLPVDDLESLKKFTFTKQAKVSKPSSWLKGKGKWATKISALTYREPEVELKRLQEKVALILEGFDINLNLPRPSAEEPEGSIFIFTSPELCSLINHRRLLNRGEDHETIESIEDYYIAGLFEPSKAKAGHLLKSYKFIPGREISPKKNMESLVYEILDDCEIVERIQGRNPSQKSCEEKENTFQEYDVMEEDKINEEVERKSDVEEVHRSKDASEVEEVHGSKDISEVEEVKRSKDGSEVEEVQSSKDIPEGVTRSNISEAENLQKSGVSGKSKYSTEVQTESIQSPKLPNLKKKHEAVEVKTPEGSPSEKRKKVEMFMSPDLFCDSDDDDDNALNQGVVELASDTGIVELVSDEEEPKTDTTPIINQTPFKPPPVKNPSQLFGTPEPMSQRSTITLKTNDDYIFDLTQSTDDDDEIEENIQAPELNPGREDVEINSNIMGPEKERDMSPDLEILDLTQCIDSDQEEQEEIRPPSPELFDLTEEIDLETKSESSDDCIVLSDDEDECLRLQDESVRKVLGEDAEAYSNNSETDEVIRVETPTNSKSLLENTPICNENPKEESPPMKRRSRSYEGEAYQSPVMKDTIAIECSTEERRLSNSPTSNDNMKHRPKRVSVFLPIEEEEEVSPPKKRRSRSFGETNVSPESTKTRRSKSFHEDNDSPVNVCNLSFEELRAKYGLAKQPSPNKELPPIRKSFSQPPPVTTVTEMDDDDFFDQLVLNKFKRRSIREPSPASSSSSEIPPSQPNSASTPKTSRVSLTQPVPSTSKAASSVSEVVSSITAKPGPSKKKTPKKRKTPQKKTAKDEEEVVIDQKIYIIKTENIPEKPDYASMDIETLSVHLKKFGLKELTRKQSVAILEHIFNQMHPYVVDETDEE